MDDGAAASALTFIVALAIVTTSLGGLLLYTQSMTYAVDDQQIHAAARQLQAGNIASMVLGHPGWSGTGDHAWDKDPDNTTRIGLASERATFLDYAKLQHLRTAPYAPAQDGYLNYEEARQGFRLDEAGLDFHIRAAPDLKDVRSLLTSGNRDLHMRTGYIGNALDAVSGGTDPQVIKSDVTCTAAGNTWRLATTGANTGNATTHLNMVFRIDTGSGNDDSYLVNGPLLAAGASHDYTLDIAAHDIAPCAEGNVVTVEAYDPVTRIDTQATTLAAPIDNATAAPHDLEVDTGKPYFLTSEDPTVIYGSASHHKDDLLDLNVTDAVGDVVHQEQFATGNKNDRTRILDPLPAGEYKIMLTDGDVTVEETLVITDAAVSPFTNGAGATTTYTWHPGVDDEVQYLDRLVARFCPFLHDDMTRSPLAAPGNHTTRCDHLLAPLQGSVFPDLRGAMNDDLPSYLLDEDGNARLDHFNLLVVGSNVDHNSMTSASAKHAIRDWVLGGGTLIVFGSEEQSVNWMQPIFHSAIQSSSGGISAPDTEHPVLRTSDPLAWSQYSTFDRSWRFTAGAGSYFTNVVNQGGEPVLAVSDPGALGDGNVFLTTWQPWDIRGDGDADPMEAMKVINNLLQLGYRELFLDYGPMIPSDAAVSSSTRVVQVEHPDLGTTTMSVTVYVFDG